MGLLHFIFAALCLPGAYAYTWTFKSPPQQCGNLTINVSGGGVPPYRVLIIPFGPTPLSNFVEARRILDIPFEGNSTELTFQLKYPQNSQLVAVVSEPFILSFFSSFFLSSTLCVLGRCSGHFLCGIPPFFSFCVRQNSLSPHGYTRPRLLHSTTPPRRYRRTQAPHNPTLQSLDANSTQKQDSIPPPLEEPSSRTG